MIPPPLVSCCIKKQENQCGRPRKHQLEKVVGQTIAKRRQSLGISQFELAERLNIAPASLSRIENGLAAPRFSRLEEIAEILDCPVSVLFRMNDETLKNTSDTIAELVGSLPPEKQKIVLDMVSHLVFALKQ